MVSFSPLLQGAEVYGLHQDYLFWLEAQSEWASALQDYSVSDAGLLSFHKGETYASEVFFFAFHSKINTVSIHVIDKDTDTAGWYLGEILLQDMPPRRGLFPSKAVKMLLRPPPGVIVPTPARPRPGSRSILEDEVQQLKQERYTTRILVLFILIIC